MNAGRASLREGCNRLAWSLLSSVSPAMSSSVQAWDSVQKWTNENGRSTCTCIVVRQCVANYLQARHDGEKGRKARVLIQHSDRMLLDGGYERRDMCVTHLQCFLSNPCCHTLLRGRGQGKASAPLLLADHGKISPRCHAVVGLQQPVQLTLLANQRGCRVQ